MNTALFVFSLFQTVLIIGLLLLNRKQSKTIDAAIQVAKDWKLVAGKFEATSDGFQKTAKEALTLVKELQEMV